MSEVGQDNMDAEVVLTVSGLFDADVQAAFTDTSAALKRGGTHSARSAQRLLLVGIVGGTAAAVVLGTVIALYLLGLASEVALGISAMAGVLIGLLAWAWAYPSLEVAPQGDTRIWRMAKYLGAVLGGLIATAIGKALFQ